MARPRGSRHTTLTETADLVVRELERIPGVKMIAPGEIRTTRGRGAGKKFLTIVLTTAGAELIISGQSVQKVAVHSDLGGDVLVKRLRASKALRDFTIAVRKRFPGE